LEDFAIFPAVSKILAIFRVFTFFVEFLTLFLTYKNAFWQQVLGLDIFSSNYLNFLKVSRKSEAAS